MTNASNSNGETSFLSRGKKVPDGWPCRQYHVLLFDTVVTVTRCDKCNVTKEIVTKSAQHRSRGKQVRGLGEEWKLLGQRQWMRWRWINLYAKYLFHENLTQVTKVSLRVNLWISIFNVTAYIQPWRISFCTIVSFFKESTDNIEYFAKMTRDLCCSRD